MNLREDKSDENQDKMSSARLHQAESSVESSPFVDNRSTAIKQRDLLENANKSSVVYRTSQLQAIADNFTQPVNPVQRKENNTGLPDNLKSGIEKLSGIPMDDVKVHRNSDKPAQLNAHAYAQGNEIHLGSGQEKHLPHEAWHVVQQKQGRVQPNKQLKSKVSINDDEGLEKEADIMGRKSIQLKESVSINHNQDGLVSESEAVQLIERTNYLANSLVQLEENESENDEDFDDIDFAPRNAISEGDLTYILDKSEELIRQIDFIISKKHPAKVWSDRLAKINITCAAVGTGLAVIGIGIATGGTGWLGILAAFAAIEVAASVGAGTGVAGLLAKSTAKNKRNQAYKEGMSQVEGLSSSVGNGELAQDAALETGAMATDAALEIGSDLAENAGKAALQTGVQASGAALGLLFAASDINEARKAFEWDDLKNDAKEPIRNQISSIQLAVIKAFDEFPPFLTTKYQSKIDDLTASIRETLSKLDS
tara:strand:- start:270 stop:1715 length:1446 start_codon:yes stop_codon:yes gene_type:complete